jgi:hypothetical protein
MMLFGRFLDTPGSSAIELDLNSIGRQVALRPRARVGQFEIGLSGLARAMDRRMRIGRRPDPEANQIFSCGENLAQIDRAKPKFVLSDAPGAENRPPLARTSVICIL